MQNTTVNVFLGGILLMLTTTLGSEMPASAAHVAQDRPQVAVAFDGGKIERIGQTYHFRAASGVEMLDVWVPPDAVPVRGLLLSGNPGGIGGDERQFTRDRGFRTFAARFGFGLLGLHSMPGGRIYGTTGAVILHALDYFAKMGKNPELSHVPFIPLGNSNGGATSYGFTNFVPERIICFASNVGSMRSPAEPTDGGMLVPGFICIGPRDPLLPSMERTKEIMTAARGKGARWCWLAEQNKGHEVGRIFDYQMVFFENCIRLRLPALTEPGGDPRLGPVQLKPLPLESGWLIDHTSWESGLTRITPYAAYTGDLTQAGWVPDEDCAVLYRGLATYNNPLTIRLANLAEMVNPNATGSFLTSMGGPVLAVGDGVVLAVDTGKYPDWKHLTFFDRSVKVGEMTHQPDAGAEVRLPLTIAGERITHSFTVLATGADGQQRTATPVHVIIGDPKQNVSDPIRPLEVLLPRKHPAPGAALPPAHAAPLAPTPRDLVAFALTAAQERQFHAGSGTVSPFWQQIAGPRSFIGMATEDGLPTMKVKAAYSRAGLYLYFKITDDMLVLPSRQNNDLATLGALDVMLDSRSVDDFWKTPTHNSFINAGWSISMTTVQLQMSLAATPDSPLHLGFVDPFEFRSYPYTLGALEKARGIRVNVAQPAPNQRVMEWFIPWLSVGNPGLKAAPACGSRLAFYPGYNYLDQQHQSKILRWDTCRDPWQLSQLKGENTSWGDLLIGPLLPK